MRQYLSTVLLAWLISLPLCAKDRAELSGSMNRLYQALINLQIMAAVPGKLNDKESIAIMEADLNSLSALKHTISGSSKSEEPGMTSVLSLFNEYIDDAKLELKRGNTEYVRHRIHTLGNFCLTCHSRVSTSKDFEDVGNRINKLSLSDFEKAELYASTRQFDKATASYRLFFEKQPTDELDFVQFTRALRSYVRLLVRVRQNPEEISKTLAMLSKRKDLPEFDRRMIKAWQEEVSLWQRDKTPAGDLTSEALLKRAKGMIENATKHQAFSEDESQDVSFLRASGYLHEILERDPKFKNRGEVLYWLGISYRTLQDPMLWNLDNLFFEQCIRENPRTELAQRCFSKYAWNNYFGYTGTGGTSIPEDVLLKMKTLRRLSETKK